MWKIFRMIGFGKVKELVDPPLTPEMEAEIEAQKVELNKFLNDHEKEYDSNEKSRVDRHNNICGNCGNTDTLKIVDKIAQVQGRGEVEGEIHGGLFSTYGHIYGKSETDTNAVNHCAVCGHQWKKEERGIKWRSDIIADRLQSLKWYIEDDVKNIENNYRQDVYDSFKKYYLETIMWLVDEGWLGISSYDRDFYKKKTLKPYFKSIHNKNTIK